MILEIGRVDSTGRAPINGNRCPGPAKRLRLRLDGWRMDVVLLRSKPLPRQSLAAALIFAGLAATPGLANPNVLPASGPWSSADYVEAIFAVQNGVITLPRQANPKTRAFFNRLTDRANIEAVMAAPLSQAEKRRDIL